VAPGFEDTANFSQKSAGLGDVLDHLGRDHAVESLAPVGEVVDAAGQVVRVSRPPVRWRA
jgi:hypothetical protein